MSQVPPPPPPASPPPPSGGAPISGCAAPFSVGDAISYGWNAYWKNVGPMILIVLAIWVVNIVLGIIAIPFDNQFMRFIIQLVAWVVSLLLALGLIRATLALTRGETPEVSMLFETDNFGPYIVAAILFGIASAIGFILCIIPGIIFVIFYGFYGFIIVDKGEQSPVEALKRSQQLVSGHFGAVLGLAVVLILINIVGAFLCGIGLLFTVGISAIAWAYAYRALSGEPVAPVS